MKQYPLRPIAAIFVFLIALTASVRATTPAGRYTTTTATVYDTKTKLTWQRTVSDLAYNWADAQTYCASAAVSASLGGPGRVPTIKELQTIIDYTLPAPDPQQLSVKMDSVAFPNTPFEYFWSSSPAAGDSSSAWAVHDYDGATNPLQVVNTYDVRCVR